jgi:hypothetical protein
MYARFSTLCLAALVSTAALGQDFGEEDNNLYEPSKAERLLLHNRYPYLPREASLGFFVGNRVIVPELRIKWEWSLLRLGRDTLYFGAEGGGGYGFNLPKTFDQNNAPPMDFFYEHVALGAVGYRMDANYGLHFCVEGLMGALFYGGRGIGVTENFIVGTFEARAKLGWRVGHMVTGVYVADGVPFSRPPGSYFQGYIGGLLLGVFANWH